MRAVGEVALLAREATLAAVKGRVQWADLLSQIHFIGIKSQAVVLITGAFTGMVLCAQTHFQFHRVQIDSATLAVVAVSMCAELGPVLTALMVAGRVGGAMAAELGTMKVTEQIDALRTLAAHPVDYLAAPRVAATTIALPVLTMEAIAIGIGAAFLLGVGLLDIDPAFSWFWARHYTTPTDVGVGLVKATCFGAVIALIGCHKGLNCGQGAEGVGRAATEAVVVASIGVLVVNLFVTLLINRLIGGG